MDRFFFDIEDGGSSRDNEGTELPDLRGARDSAHQMLGQELCDRGGSFWEDPELRLTVRDANDLILMRLTVFGTMAPAMH
jgi:hypothetical protein